MENDHFKDTDDVQKKPKVRRKKKSLFNEVWGRLKKNKRAMVSLSVIVILFGLAIFADLIANYDLRAVKQNVANRLLFPTIDHWFGTDLYGRDIFARIIHGTRIALILGFGATSISIIIASILGSTAAYFGGKFDYVVTRIVDTLLAIPSLLLALALVASIGSGLIQLVIAISLGQIANFTRIIRSAALSVVNLEFIEAGKALGASHSWIVLRYVIPNIIGIVLIQGAMQVSMNILMGATLSFVGLGIQVPIPEWGAMLAEGLSYMQYRPYLVIVPGIFLMITALSINTFGDCLRDAFDPRLKGKS
jgi:peptide/nickel transport system permease protein